MKAYGSAAIAGGPSHGGHIPVPLVARPTGRTILTDLERAHRPTTVITLADPQPAPVVELPPPPRAPRTPAHVIDDAVHRYTNGHTIPAIAAALRTSTATVRRHLKSRGIQLRDDRTRSGGQNRRQIDAQQLLQLKGSGLTLPQIAARLDLSVTTTHRALAAIRKSSHTSPRGTGPR